jgi:hypothetical protein
MEKTRGFRFNAIWHSNWLLTSPAKREGVSQEKEQRVNAPQVSYTDGILGYERFFGGGSMGVGDGQLRHHRDSNPSDPAHNRMIANARISSERRV